MELLNNTVTKILQIVNNYAVPMYEIWENNKNKIVNQKQFKGRKKKSRMQFQLESTEQNKKAYHVDLSEEFQAKPQRKQ